MADDYSAWLQEELGAVIDELELDERQKRFMHSRWLEQIVWLETKARGSQRSYYGLRLVAIVGGLVVPALVSLNVQDDVASAVAWTTFGLSLVVAVAVAVEGFFHHGERWRHYRRTAELLKSQGWQFHGLAGRYTGFPSHGEAFRLFSTTVEELIEQDVDVYVTRVMGARQQGGDTEAEQKPEG